jgi:hypothetical protein
MIYTLIGKLVVRAAKLFLRRKYGPTLLPKPLLAGVVVLLVGFLVVLGKRFDESA